MGNDAPRRTIHLTDEVWRSIKVRAASDDVSPSAVVEKAVAAYLGIKADGDLGFVTPRVSSRTLTTRAT